LRYIVTLGEEEVSTMRGIAKLLFGADADGLADLFGGSDADGFGLADRARRAGEWCGSTPGRASAAGAADAAARPHGLRHGVISRQFRIR
jgi:hypothetical protein